MRRDVTTDPRNPRWVQLGIVHGSVGPCASADFPGIYSRVEDKQILDFIKFNDFGIRTTTIATTTTSAATTTTTTRALVLAPATTPKNAKIKSYQLNHANCDFQKDICNWQTLTNGDNTWKLATRDQRPDNLMSRGIVPNRFGFIYFDTPKLSLRPLAGNNKVELVSQLQYTQPYKEFCISLW